MKWLKTFLFLFPGFGCFSQNPEKLTFQEAVKIGLERNITLLQQKNQMIYTQLNKTSNLLQLGPAIQANGSAGRFDGNSFNQQRGEVINGQIDFLNGSIGANVPVFNGFNRLNSYRQADSWNDAQLNFVQRTTQDIICMIANQFLNCLLDQQLLNIDRQNLETQKAQYDQIKAQVDVGARAEADLYNQEYQVKNVEMLIVRSSNRLKNDKALLAQTLMLDPIVSFELEEVSWDFNQMLGEETSIDHLSEEAFEFRSDLKQAQSAERASRYGFYASRGRYYPNLSAFGQLSSRYNYIFGKTDNRTFDQQFRKDNRQLSYGLQLTIPIFNGFVSRVQTTQFKVAYENSKLDKKGLEVKVKTQVLLAQQNYADAKTTYMAAEAQLKAAELSYRVEKERFDLGISNIVQLVQANQANVRALSDVASARYTLMFQKILLNYATGTLKVENIP